MDKLIDEMTDEEKELLFNNREYMNPIKILDWFVKNRQKISRKFQESSNIKNIVAAEDGLKISIRELLK
ncbi:MAG: hypothetical protein CEE43_17985 [Promethearchaeota archaeon Loki_b32]|nr:MAG: hypothetical protein CEE43_17985 [Candidatus Lokiarchaeota archaeon Loki_b32]